MKVQAYIRSLKNKEHDRHVLGEAEIIECIGDNLYLAEVNGVRCTAIFNFFTGAYYVDDVYGIRSISIRPRKTFIKRHLAYGRTELPGIVSQLSL